MEGDSSTPLFPIQQQDDYLPIIYPELSVWDVGFDRIFHSDSPEAEVIPTDTEKSKQPEKTHGTELHGASNQQQLQKKIVHRDIERQRRRDMATLYSSLRSALPSQCLQGNRSISDQIYAATNYITCLKNNIKQMEIKRENIKRLGKNELLNSEKGSSSKSLPNVVVRVQPCSVGIEVLISGDFIEDEGLSLPLSRILQLLLAEGLNVVDCNCTRVDGNLHYVIQSEVPKTYPGLNLQMLQTKLMSRINTLADIKKR